ncbi:protein misato homolog 1 [Hydra vulgaris]|uniref:Protein misato homolog 1 n=1 Tax=Hydra vulgaris TaxID=6087 RepID=T2M6W6_HYDVU|nr:protein misato homolog 1 [Hydra vulgaris]
METQEVITLQFGSYSNYVGAHYWNLQQKAILDSDEEDNIKLFKSSFGKHKNKFPRTICFDIKNSLKTLKEDGSFTDELKQKENINGLPFESEPVLYEQDLFKKNLSKESKDFEETVTTWTDFMEFELQENSLQLLSNNYNDGESFTCFGLGKQEFLNIREEFEDKLHFWVEECNNLEGFQVFTDFHNGFSGLSSQCVEDLRDEYNKKCLLSYLNWPVHLLNKENCIYEDINAALAFRSYMDFCDLSVIQSLQKDMFDQKSLNVVNIENINYKPNLQYHTSAVLAATIDCTSLSWRLPNRKISMSEQCYLISQGTRTFAGSAFSVPFVKSSNTLLEKLYSMDSYYDSLVFTLSPYASKSLVPFNQLITLRNIPENMIIPSVIKPALLQSLGLNSNVFNLNPISVLDFFSSKFYPSESTISHSFYSKQRLDLGFPFPSIINGKSGDKKDLYNNVTSMGALYSSPSFNLVLNEVVKRIKKLSTSKKHILQEFDLNNDLAKELIEDLQNLAYIYDDCKLSL